ncbi:metallo-beta-lactamase superfamily protein [Diaporthe amygdali]|uniref:metallo-beta-lactamase superfamily protein n=1 Tax=Phomopsis amygdali TaxID=1214568 RepID=UPI0022FE6255|nr:metallo-beta-lactamase superfamily protein [Diaporthe amygdali]KAJ0117515.1 metallo-beta-lactamase superfamily protein [Diaporthe amygdali]
MMASHGLLEVDYIEIKVIVDNEVDPISPSNNPAVQYTGFLQGVSLDRLPSGDDRGGAVAELKMGNICCGAHGLSLMITAKKGDATHTMLFDTGPEESTWERNATRIRANIASIEHIHLSHWHRDHSGGMLEAIRMINASKIQRGVNTKPPKVVVDLHPDRPDYRGMMTPDGTIVSLEADPAFDEIKDAGGVLLKKSDVHPVLDGFFLTSGAIPRATPYELGIRGGMRFSESTGKWSSDESISDERLVMCNLKGKGLVVFTGCSHAGVINVSKHAIDLVQGVPLYAVVGGFHLADNQPEKLESSLADLKSLGPKVLMPGHCTGYKFKFLIEQAIPGILAPSFCGTTYTLV